MDGLALLTFPGPNMKNGAWERGYGWAKFQAAEQLRSSYSVVIVIGAGFIQLLQFYTSCTAACWLRLSEHVEHSGY